MLAVVDAVAALGCGTAGQALYPLVPAGYGTVADLCPTSCGQCSADQPPEKFNAGFSCSAAANATTDYWVGEVWATATEN